VELDSAIKAVLSGKYDADFLEHQTWGLPGIQCLAELIKEGHSSTFTALKTTKEHIATKEKQHIQAARRFFDLEASVEGQSSAQAGSKSKSKGNDRHQEIIGVSFPTAPDVEDEEQAILSKIFLKDFKNVPPFQILLVHGLDYLPSFPLASTLSNFDFIIFLISSSMPEVVKGCNLICKAGFSLFDSVIINLGVQCHEPAHEGNLHNNCMFISIFAPKEFSGEIAAVMPSGSKEKGPTFKELLALWKGTLVRQRGGIFGKYPSLKSGKLILDTPFFIRLFSSFRISIPAVSSPLTLFEIPETHCSALLAAVTSGLGYLAFQPSTKTLAWLRSSALALVKKEVSEDQWLQWLQISSAITDPQIQEIIESESEPEPQPEVISKSKSHKTLGPVSVSNLPSKSFKRKRDEAPSEPKRHSSSSKSSHSSFFSSGKRQRQQPSSSQESD
jgi:hypothetical protein